MLYQAYQAHADIVVPVRHLAGMVARSVVGDSMGPYGRRS
jgi:hypothetical protein